MTADPEQSVPSAKRTGDFSLQCPLRRRSDANSEAGPKGEGQEARSQEKCTKRKTPQRCAFRTSPAFAGAGSVLQVRARRRAVSTAHPCADETMADILSTALRADPPPGAATQGPNSGGHPARMVRACLRAVAPESPFSPCGRLQAQDAPANSEAGPEGERHGVARVTCRRRKRGVFA